MSPVLPLCDAADRYFMDPASFLAAFERDHRAAIIALRDDPTAFGPCRSYVGKQAIAFARKKLLAAARREWKRVDPTANIVRTRRRPPSRGTGSTPPPATSSHQVRGS